MTAKHNRFVWLGDHQRDFERVKSLLTLDLVVTNFDSNLPLTVLTDASRLHGLGFAMGHMVDDLSLRNEDMPLLSWSVLLCILRSQNVSSTSRGLMASQSLPTTSLSRESFRRTCW